MHIDDIRANAKAGAHGFPTGRNWYEWCQAFVGWMSTISHHGTEPHWYPSARAAWNASPAAASTDPYAAPPGALHWFTAGHPDYDVKVSLGGGRVMHAYKDIGQPWSPLINVGEEVSWDAAAAKAPWMNSTYLGWTYGFGPGGQYTVDVQVQRNLEPHERLVTAGGPANGRSQPSTSSPVVQQIPGNDYGEFDGWIYGENVSGNNVWFRGKFSKNWFWSGSFTSTSTSGLTDLNPKEPTDPTKRVTNDVVRVRQEPTTASTHVKTYDANTTHTIMGWKNGQTVEGIKEWFRTVDGWVWSDGFTNRSTAGLTDLNTTPDPDPEPTPDPGEYTPNLVSPKASDFPAWIRFEEVLKPGVTTQRNVEDAEYYGMKYNPVESHVHWWGTPGESGTHDSNVAYLNRSADLDTNFVTSPGRITMTIPLNIIAYTTGRRNPYGWKSENDPSLTELGYKTLAYLHYIVEKLNPSLGNEAIRLHKEFSATSCSDIDPEKVRAYANKFKTGEWDPSTGEPPVTPDPDPTPAPGELVEELSKLNRNLETLNTKLDNIFKN